MPLLEIMEICGFMEIYEYNGIYGAIGHPGVLRGSYGPLCTRKNYMAESSGVYMGSILEQVFGLLWSNSIGQSY